MKELSISGILYVLYWQLVFKRYAEEKLSELTKEQTIAKTDKMIPHCCRNVAAKVFPGGQSLFYFFN